MNEMKLESGQFMGHTVRRAQVLLADRRFLPIPLTFPTRAQGSEHWDGETKGVYIHSETGVKMVNPSPPLAPAVLPSWQLPSWGNLKSAVDRYTAVDMAADTWVDDDNNVQPRMPHPERSAYEHTQLDRPVPVVRLDVQPTFYMDDTVEGAMRNSVNAVCADVCYGELPRLVHNMLMAEYRPLGIYKPDVDGRWQETSGTSSLVTKYSIALPDLNGEPWQLDLRICTGAYTAHGHTWLGVYVHGVALPLGPGADRLSLTPSTEDEEAYWLQHRGVAQPESLFFDMVVPVEPEIVTEEWGWGEDLEALTEQRTENARKSALDAQSSSLRGPAAGNMWDRKAKRHKSARQIAQAQGLLDHESHQLAARMRISTAERERARQVLFKYGWKAVMLAVIECKQLILKERT